MEGLPKNRATQEKVHTDNEYGPQNKEQRLRLRHALAGIGIGLAAWSADTALDTDTSNEAVETAADSLESTSAEDEATDVYRVGSEVYTTQPAAEGFDEDTQPDTELGVVDTESIETLHHAPHFEAYEQAAAAAYTMRRDQVVLTDKWGQMLGDGPVDLHDAAGYTPAEMTWRYQDGPAVGIPGMLTNELRETVSNETGVPTGEITVRHEYLGMLKDEFAEYESLQAVALHNANQEVPNDPQGRNFLEVIEAEFSSPIQGADGPFLASLLKETLPALISKESLFNVDAVSSAGARGALQFMPGTWEDYAPEGADPTSFAEAVDAAGEYFAASYEYLYKTSLNELDVIESEFFPGDHDGFVRDFVFPYLINGYNAGDGTMRQALEHFTREHGTQGDLQDFYKTTELVGGKDVFFALTRIEATNDDVAMYQQYASAYSLEVLARAAAGTRLNPDNEQYAQLTE